MRVQLTTAVALTVCGDPDGVVVSVYDTVTLSPGQISRDPALDGRLVPQTGLSRVVAAWEK